MKHMSRLEAALKFDIAEIQRSARSHWMSWEILHRTKNKRIYKKHEQKMGIRDKVQEEVQAVMDQWIANGVPPLKEVIALQDVSRAISKGTSVHNSRTDTMINNFRTITGMHYRNILVEMNGVAK